MPRKPPPPVVSGFLTRGQIKDGQVYLLWSYPSRGWWCPKGAGYTGEVTQAGTYTADDARMLADVSRASSAPWSAVTLAVPVSKVAPLLRRLREQINDQLAAWGEMDGLLAETTHPLARLRDGEL